MKMKKDYSWIFTGILSILAFIGTAVFIGLFIKIVKWVINL